MWRACGLSLLDMDELRGSDLELVHQAASEYEEEVRAHGTEA